MNRERFIVYTHKRISLGASANVQRAMCRTQSNRVKYLHRCVAAYALTRCGYRCLTLSVRRDHPCYVDACNFCIGGRETDRAIPYRVVRDVAQNDIQLQRPAKDQRARSFDNDRFER